MNLDTKVRILHPLFQRAYCQKKREQLSDKGYYLFPHTQTPSLLSMPNNNYRNGASKERRIVNEAKKAGSHIIAFRSAGSHSPIDVTIIDLKNKLITFVQSKLNKYGLTKKETLDFICNSDVFSVQFKVLNRGEVS